MSDTGEYSPLDWTLDLILELNEMEPLGPDKLGVSWRIIVDTLDAIGWPRGPVEEIIGEALETGAIYEPVMGNIRIVDHEHYVGRDRERETCDNILIHNAKERLQFKVWVVRKIEAWDTRKAEPSLFDMKISGIPRHIGEEILGILAENGITTVTTRPTGGIS